MCSLSNRFAKLWEPSVQELAIWWCLFFGLLAITINKSNYTDTATLLSKETILGNDNSNANLSGNSNSNSLSKYNGYPRNKWIIQLTIPGLGNISRIWVRIIWTPLDWKNLSAALIDSLSSCQSDMSLARAYLVSKKGPSLVSNSLWHKW